MEQKPSSEQFLAGITVGDLRRRLASFPDDAELYFGGLTFYRLKTRGADLVQLEFNEQVSRASDGTLKVVDLSRNSQ